MTCSLSSQIGISLIRRFFTGTVLKQRQRFADAYDVATVTGVYHEKGERKAIGDISRPVVSSASYPRNFSSTRGESGLKTIANNGDLIRAFATQAAWDRWLKKNHRNSPGLWLRLAKKGSATQSVTYAEALEVALCYGWIDGQKRGESADAWLQRFLPRSEKSIWSKINRDKAILLIASGCMQPAGSQAVEAAKRTGRWEAAYDSPRGAIVPDDFQAALNASPRARKFFEDLDGANRYAVLFRIQTVKKVETRARKIREFVAMLERHETIHAPRKANRTRKAK